MTWFTKLCPVGLAVAVVACTASHDVGPEALSNDIEGPVGSIPLSLKCEQEIEDSIDGMPNDLSCTGLYSNFQKQLVAKGVQTFTPAHTLWSDAADKTRWIFLPAGKTIDASDPSSWVFPVGTKAWKEFRVDGKRIETRIYEKTDPDRWGKATYQWNDDDTAATRVGMKDFMIGSRGYHIPSGTECSDCHGGRKDQLLGFEQAALGLDGAQGITLADLVAKKRITHLQGETHLELGDDGSGVAEPALGWIHINCGVSCHNANPNSKGYARDMRLDLDPTELDGRDASEFLVVKTTVGQDAKTMRWAGQKRIVAGDPENSLLYVLITQRGDKQQQMPPIASLMVDEANSAIIGEWISKLADK